jgi:hypothetical protein
MRLDDWTALSPDEHRAHSERWRNQALAGETQNPEETEWLELVNEAADRFARKYDDLPDLLYVGHSCWFDAQHPIMIFAHTRLRRGQTLARLPVEYATFPVTQQALADDIQAHKDTWSAVLGRLFGWDRAAIADFIAGQEWVWRSRFFLHDPPCEQLPPQALAKSALKSWRGYDEAELHRIGQELVRAIGGRFYLHEEPDYDWRAAQERIARIARIHDRAFYEGAAVKSPGSES